MVFLKWSRTELLAARRARKPSGAGEGDSALGTNEWLRTKMGVNGRAMVVSRYEWNRSVDQMEAIYKRIADDEHSPR